MKSIIAFSVLAVGLWGGGLRTAAGTDGLTASAAQGIRQAFLTQRAGLAAARRTLLLEAFEERLAEAVAREQAASQVRNMREQMIARSARDLFAHSLKALQEEGVVALPETVRRGLEPLLTEARARCAQIEERFAERVAAARREAETALAALRPTLAPEALAAAFDQLLETDSTAAAPPAAGGFTPLDETGFTPLEPEEEPAYYALSSGQPVAGWVLVGRFTGSMRGPDIVKLQVMERGENWTSNQFNPMTGQTSDLEYTAELALPRNRDYVYRLKRVAGLDSVDLIEWPNPRSGWQLVVRTRSAPVIPHKVGFEIEAALPEADLAARLGRGEIGPGAAPVATRRPDPATLISIPVRTDPPRARVYVNDRPYEDDLGPVLTPCTIKLPPGSHTIALEREFFQTKVVSNYVAQPGQRIDWAFVAQDDLPWQVFEWEPPADWRGTRVTVNVNDQVLIEARGQWVIGGFRPAGPEGYPPEQFPEYYQPTDRRLWPEAPYGALLVRFGAEGQTNYYGASRIWHMHREQGEIFFNVNAEPESALRRRNRGKIRIRMAVIKPRLRP